LIFATHFLYGDEIIMRHFYLILLCLIFFPVMVSAEEIIIESCFEGKNFECYQEMESEFAWFDSVAKSTAPGCSSVDIGSRFLTVNDANDGEARFTPDIKQAGKYTIYVTWGTSGNAIDTAYEINTGSKKEIKLLTQAGWGGDLPPNGNQWISLGTYDLPAGKTAYVAVKANQTKGGAHSENSARVYADAVRFVTGGGASPGQAASNAFQASSPPSSPPPFSRTSSSPFAAKSNLPGSTPSFPSPLKPSSSSSSPFSGSSSFSAPSKTTSRPSPFGTKKTNSGSPFNTSSSQVFAPSSSPSNTAKAPFNPYGSSFSASQATVTWHNDYSTAINEGIQKQKSIIIFFSSSFGRSSRKMEKEILESRDVKSILANSYVCLKVDISQSQKICEYYGIFKAPALVFLDNRGYSKSKIDTLIQPQQLAAELNRYK
jgi:thioredoxin family protein